MGAQQSASGPAPPGPGDQRVPTPHVPEPDISSPLHPEAPGPEYRAQVVATGSDQVRSYLARRGMPAEEIGRRISAAHRDGTVTFPEAPEPDHPGERLRLSFVDNTCQLAIQGV